MRTEYVHWNESAAAKTNSAAITIANGSDSTGLLSEPSAVPSSVVAPDLRILMMPRAASTTVRSAIAKMVRVTGRNSQP